MEPVTILLAEDDDGHANLVQRNLDRAGLAVPAKEITTGSLLRRSSIMGAR